MTHQGKVEALTRWGSDAYLLAQHLDIRLASTDSLRITAQFSLASILSVDEALHDLGTLAFFALHLFSAVGRHTAAVTDILCLIEKL